MKYTDILSITGQPEYERDFRNMMCGLETAKDRLAKGRVNDTGAYLMPTSEENKYEKAIGKESLFHSIASVLTCYDCPANIFAVDCDDIAEYTDEFGSIDIKEIADDFTRIPVTSRKLATFFRMSNEFVSDATFDVGNYLVNRMAKNFAKAEDKSFILGNGVKEPIGILHPTAGGEVAVNTDAITYDDVIGLYFSVKSEYRKNAVWLMNDTTAMELRKLKDADGNYLWNNADNTILGKSVLISEYMPDATPGTKPIAFGDFGYYWIIKRSPVTVKALKELFAVTGQIGYLAFEFLDGKLIRRDAVKVIQMNQAE